MTLPVNWTRFSKYDILWELPETKAPVAFEVVHFVPLTARRFLPSQRMRCHPKACRISCGAWLLTWFVWSLKMQVAWCPHGS